MSDGSNSIAGPELRGFIERLERLDASRQDLSDDMKVVYAEAKSRGYTPRYIKAILKLRKTTPSEREEAEAMLDLYKAAMGMADETPLFRHVAGMGGDALAREQVIEALKLLAPEDGEFTVRIGSGPRVRIWRDWAGPRVEDVPDALWRGTAPGSAE